MARIFVNNLTIFSDFVAKRSFLSKLVDARLILSYLHIIMKTGNHIIYNILIVKQCKTQYNSIRNAQQKEVEKMDPYQDLKEQLTQMQPQIIEAIQGVVRIPSVKSEAQPDAPYGPGPKAALQYTLKLAKSLGLKTGCMDNRVGWAEYGTGSEMVGVLGHLDVVPAGEGWNTDPFGAEIQNGILYGRGVLDDKGPVIGALYALKAIRDAKLPLRRRIRVLFGTDEEHGSSCMQYYNTHGGEQPTLGFTPDADYPLIYCEKGTTNVILGGEVKDRGNIRVLHFEGGTAANIVTPSCTLQVEGKLHVQEMPGIEVHYQDGCTTVTAKGKGAHGSTPELGENAAVKLLLAVQGNAFGGDFQKMADFITQMLAADTCGQKLGIYDHDPETGDTTVNLGIVHYDGTNLEMTLDIRHPKTTDPDRVKAQVLTAAKRYGLPVQKFWQVPLLYVAKSSPLVQTLLQVYTQETGKHAEPMAIGGGTYAKCFPNTVGFGPVFPGDENVIHQPNEHVEIEKLMRACRITAAAMAALAQIEQTNL